MKQVFSRTPLFLFTLLLLGQISQAQAGKDRSLLRVVIIRHGEKPAEGDNLSCQGLNRALKLSDVLYSKFKAPDFIYVPSIKTGKKTGVARMYQTIVPFAVKYNLQIDTKYDVDDIAGLTGAITKKTGTVFVIWEHLNIPLIAKQLGVDDKKLKWKGEDFDSIWIITYKDGKAVLTIDKENIIPKETCN